MLIFYLNAVNNDKEISGPNRKCKEDFVDFVKLIKMKKMGYLSFKLCECGNLIKWNERRTFSGVVKNIKFLVEI